MTSPALLALSTGAIIAICVVVGLILIVGIIISMYNALVRDRNRVKNGFAQIDVQLKRRYDLIPNLIETAKGYMAHEKGTFEAVTEARNQAMSAAKSAAKDPTAGGAVKALSNAEGALTGALGRLTVTMEAYPDLKAQESFQHLQSELSDIEEKIAYSRQFYNRNVLDYNTAIQSFPQVMLAGMFGFQQSEFFEAEDEARADVRVSFSS